MTVIYHNPRCTKSREALRFLESKINDFEVIKYLDTPLSKNELRQLLKQLGMRASDVVRTKEKLFNELELSKRDLSDAEWIEILAEHPKLLERPIVVHNGKAAIGRPIDNVVALFE